MTCSSCGVENREGARFCDSCGAALDDTPARQQRKVVTVLFCDVTGSTALGESLDPEALRATMARYFVTARAAVERHGGTVEKFIGDAVMAVFGVPSVHEDDALRAVRAAQELRDAVELDVRVGVNTGRVVTGDADSLVTGDAVNVAARLEQAAQPGEVVIGAETYALVRDAVDAELLPPIEAKGKAAPLTAYRLRSVTGDTGVARRGDAPLVGRARERLLLDGAWARAVSERAAVLFTVLGSAGVGKSRLAGEFLDGTDATVVRGRCLSYGDGITYWPVVEVVKQLLAGSPADDPALAALLAGGHSSADDIAVAVRKLLERAAAERPVVVLFDDIHWGEPTFLDLVEHVADWSRDAPVLLLCLARPELLDVRPGWGGGKVNAASVLLEPLSASETDELIDALIGGHDLAPSLRERIRTAADGNPLFVEQMLAMVEESPGEVVTVPASIQALLAARLDQLQPSERATLERGAVEGHVFHRAAVAALAPEDTNVAANLLGLVRKELVRPSAATLPGDDAFRFRHLLIRDAAYDALPKAKRAELHERFATWIEERAPELVELDEIVGYHLEQAVRSRRDVGLPDDGLAVRAADRLGAAGVRAERREDAPAARGLLRRALRLYPEGDPRRVALLPPLAHALYDAGDIEAMHRALAEAIETGDAETAAHALFLRNFALGHSAEARLGELAAEIEEAIEREGLSDATLAAGYLALARIAYWRGALTEQSAAGRRAIDHARRAGRHDLLREAASTIGTGLKWDATPWPEVERIASELYEETQAVALLSTLAHAAVGQDRFDEARGYLAKEARVLEERGSRLDLATRSMIAAYVEFLADRYGDAEPTLRDGWDELGRMGEQGYRATVGSMLAEALVALGRHDEAIEILDEAEQLTSGDDFVGVAGIAEARARAALSEGDADAAVEQARRALEIVAETEYQAMECELWLLYAEALRAAGRGGDAREAALRALGLAEVKQTAVFIRQARGLLDALPVAD